MLSPLPDWLHNLARGLAGIMVSLDTFRANFCLWRCITVHQRARPDRTTIAARQLARASFRDCPRTSLDELDKVERHLNKGKTLENWLGICVYKQEWIEAGNVVWHPRRNAPPKVKNILMIGVFNGHAFLIKDFEKLAKNNACVHCCARFTQA